MKEKLLLIILLLCAYTALCQKPKTPRIMGNILVADSNASLMIPVHYNSDLLATSKLALGHGYFANIIFYEMANDTHKKLFQKDTFIRDFTAARSAPFRPDPGAALSDYSSKEWIFYFVMNSDSNENGRIDADDPAVLYVSDKMGNRLQALTPVNEHAMDISILDKQGFALIKMQRDLNGDKRFDSKDDDYYYVRLNLHDLSLGNKIELREAN